MTVGFIFLNIDRDAETEILQQLRAIPQVMETYFVYGVYDIIAKVDCTGLPQMLDLRNKIRGFRHVRSLLTLITADRKTLSVAEPFAPSVDTVEARRLREDSLRLETITQTYLRRKYPKAKVVQGESHIRFYIVNRLGIQDAKLENAKLADFIVHKRNGHFSIVETTIGEDLAYKIQQLQSTAELLSSFPIDSIELHVQRPFVRRDGLYRISRGRVYTFNEGDKRLVLPIMIGSKAVTIKTHFLRR